MVGSETGGLNGTGQKSSQTDKTDQSQVKLNANYSTNKILVKKTFLKRKYSERWTKLNPQHLQTPIPSPSVTVISQFYV